MLESDEKKLKEKIGSLFNNVITSYSIHYTKLYDFLHSRQTEHLLEIKKLQMQVKIFRVQNDPAGLNLGKFQDIVDQ